MQPPRINSETSQLVDVLSATAGIPVDALVVRGYLGRSDLVQRTNELVGRAFPGNQNWLIRYVVQQILGKDEITAQTAWRLYLTPQLDSYIEFAWPGDVLAWTRDAQPSSASEDDGATMSETAGETITVWLRHRSDGSPYRIVSSKAVERERKYIRGDLIEDFLVRDRAGGSWDAAPVSKKYSGVTCIG